MTNLTSVGQTMTSMQIAETTGKQHKDVLRAIRNMEPAWEKTLGRKFALQFRINKLATGGESKIPYYSLTKTECLYIATKFNDEARARLILRWEELENEKSETAKKQRTNSKILPPPIDNSLSYNNLVESLNDKTVTTSRKLAAVLGRKHDSVLETIKNNLHQRAFKYGNFTTRDYSSGPSSRGYEFLITRKGLDALAGVMRYNAKNRIAEAYAGAWMLSPAKVLPAPSVEERTEEESGEDIIRALAQWIDELRADLRKTREAMRTYAGMYEDEKKRRLRNGDMSGRWHDLYEDLLWRVVCGTDGTSDERLAAHREFVKRLSSREVKLS